MSKIKAKELNDNLDKLKDLRGTERVIIHNTIDFINRQLQELNSELLKILSKDVSE